MRGFTALACLGAVAAAQLPLPKWSNNAAGMMPASDMKLSSIGDEFTSFAHPAYPMHSMKIKSTSGWCDPGVKSYSGYLNTGFGKDLFFYFFESRSSPKDDPVIMWINGGPGCASELGMFMELGPCTISDPTNLNGTKLNPHSWNEKANLFFLDEPIGVGFSQGRHGQHVSTTEQAAVDIQAFVALFFATFTEFQSRPFIMSGESYGGRYLPVFASAVLDGNAKLEKHGMKPINLTKVLIGNGMTDEMSMMEAYYTFQCVRLPDMEKPLQSVGNCVAMAKALPMCKQGLKEECVDRHDYLRCKTALITCEDNIGAHFWELGLNPYDVTKTCSRAELSDGLCYGDVIRPIVQYLDQPSVRSFLGVDPSLGPFATCSNRVGRDFNSALDMADQTWLYVASLLEHGVDVMAYIGQLDYICNYFSSSYWTEHLQWTGGEGFKKTELREWSVGGKVAGETKTYKGLTYTTVARAGHMVPYDKPAEALAMLNRYISGEKL